MDQIKKTVIEEYWLKKLSGDFPKVSLPLSRTRQEGGVETQQTGAPRNTLDIPIPAGVMEKLTNAAKQSDMALFILALSGLYIALNKYTGISELTVGTTPPESGTNGNSGSLLFCRSSVSNALTIKEFIMQTKQDVVEALKHSEYSLEPLLEKLQAKNNGSFANLFNVAFVFTPFQPRPSSLDRFDLVLSLSAKDQPLALRLSWPPQSLSTEIAHVFGQNLVGIFENMLKQTDRTISDLEALTPGEKNHWIYDVNRTEADYPKAKTIHQLVEEQVMRIPGTIAVEAGRGESQAIFSPVTYEQLNRRADHLARYLREKGVTPETNPIVGIMVSDSRDMITCVLAVLKAGGAYLPIDPGYPEKRIRFMVGDSGAGILLVPHAQVETNQEDVSQSFHSSRQLAGVDIIGVSEFIGPNGSAAQQENDSVVDSLNSSPDEGAYAENLAYIIYTSGSTGTPKGVMVEHRSVVNYITWAIKSYIGSKKVNVPLFTPLSFDLTVTSILAPLLSGNTIIAYDQGKDGNLSIEEIINDSRLDLMKLTPSHLKLALQQSVNAPTSAEDTAGKITSGISGFIVGGEVFDVQLARDVTQRIGKTPVIYNEYGPTEATVGCMIYRYSSDPDTLQSVPIGRPAANVQIYLLNRNHHPVPVGVSAELYISGDGVARGYLNRPELTREKFIPNPFVAGKRLYRTGDLARYLPDGNIQFLGRIDQQVKISGFRIEPDEIQDHLKNYRKHEPITLTDNKPVKSVPREITYCTRCFIPHHYPGVRFDADGVCNICLEYEKYKTEVDSYFKDSDDFLRLVEQKKQTNKKQGKYDCLLLFSGGKDSTYALYKLIDMGLNVLTYTFDNGFISEAAFENIERITTALGVDHIVSTANHMDKIFVESLNTTGNVCPGCWNALNTLGAKVAYSKGTNLVVSGLSRGQIFEMRLEGLFEQQIFDDKEVEENLLLFRKSFHSKENKFAKILNVPLSGEVVEQIYFVDFFRYYDSTVQDIKSYLESNGWVQPKDTGFCSSNCKINDVGIYVHFKEKGYHFYSEQLSWDYRLGAIDKEEALREFGFDGNEKHVDQVLRKIGYYNPPIKDAVVIDKTNENGEKYLRAYLVSNETLTVHELREHLSQQLPDYMIPSSFMQVKKIPLTGNGKIDLEALDVMGKRLGTGTAYTAPTNDIERKILDVWKDILHLDQMGIHDNFFDLGGTSFEIIRINGNLREIFQIDIPVVNMFRYTTINAFANYINNEEGKIRDRAEAFSRAKNDRMKVLNSRKRAVRTSQ
ncbi:MAG: amino acid adenylation domain-containing protein [bacterium]|nr:amino acid adenylation domain-containing protein [bacterium]